MGMKEVSLWVRKDSCLLRFEQGFTEEEKDTLTLDFLTLCGGCRAGEFVEVNGGEYSESNLRGKLLVKGIKIRGE